MAKVTLRQLQWWDERGVVSPHHQQHRRLYTTRDVMEILVLSELRRKGISLQKIRWSLGALREALEATGIEPDLFLVTDLKSLQLTRKTDEVLDICKQAGHGVYVVSIGDLMKRIPAAGGQLPLF